MPSTVPRRVSMSVISGEPANISGSAPVTSAMARRLRSPTICVEKRFSTRCALPITPTTGLVIASLLIDVARSPAYSDFSVALAQDFAHHVADDIGEAALQRPDPVARSALDAVVFAVESAYLAVESAPLALNPVEPCLDGRQIVAVM